MFIKLERKLLAVLLLTIFLSHLPITFVHAQGADENGHLHNVNAVRWNHNGTFLASASRDETIKLWTPEGEYSRLLQSPIVGEFDIILNIEWSPDDKYIASAGVNRTVFVWNMTSDDLRPQVIHNKHFDYIKGIAWHPNMTDNGLIATGGNDGYTRLWNASFPVYETDTDGNATKLLSSEAVLRNLASHEKIVRDLEWNPSGEILSAVGIDGTHKIIAINPFSEQYELLAPGGFGFSDPDPIIDLEQPILSLAVDENYEYFVYALGPTGTESAKIVTYQAFGSFNTNTAPYLPTLSPVGEPIAIDCQTDCINMEVQISPDGDKIAIAGGSKIVVYPFDEGIDTESTIYSYDITQLNDGSEYFDDSTKVVSTSWHPDNEELAFAAGPDVFAVDTVSGDLIFRIQGEFPQSSNVLLIGIIVVLGLIVLYLIYRRVRKPSLV